MNGQSDCLCTEVGEIKSGNIFMRKWLGKKGQEMLGHEHNFDHTTYVLSGKLRAHATFPASGATKTVIISAGDHLLIEANWVHRFEILEDSRFDCIYSHRDAQGEVVQECDGWNFQLHPQYLPAYV